MQIGNSQIEFVIATSRSSLLPWFPSTIKAIPSGIARWRFNFGSPIEIDEGWTVDAISQEEPDLLQILDPNEKALMEKGEPEQQRLLTIGLLIFSLAFCALVFQAGWKEALAYEKCGGGANCKAAASAALRAP